MARATEFWGRMKGFVTKKASKTNPNLIPVKRENTQIRRRSEPVNPAMPEGAGTDCIKVQVPVEKRREPAVFRRAAWRCTQLSFRAESRNLLPFLASMNRLYFGNNLKWLSDRKEFPDASVDLVYLDPPFNSNADYNVLFREPSGQVSQAQFHAFTDTWSWADAADTYHQFIDNCPNIAVVELMEALHSFLKHSPMMAYLAMMAPRLVELHRVLKPTGSLYLHCDPTADHYLRMLFDGIFGAVNFRDEIIWKRSSSHADIKQGMRRCGRIHDVLLLYAKSDTAIWNPVFTPYDEDYVESMYRFVDDQGRRYREGDLTAAGPAGDVSFEWRVKRRINSNERWVSSKWE